MKHLLFIVMCFNLGCATSKDGTTPPAVCHTSTCIIAFGDSITVGLGTSDPEHKGYAALVAQHYNREFVDLGVGHSVLDSPSEMGQITNYPYIKGQTVVMLSGYNDMRGAGIDAVRLANYGNKLDEAFTIWEKNGVEVYIGGCLKMIPSSPQIANASDTAADLYAQELLNRAAGHPHVHVVDTHALWMPTVSNLNVDLTHPNNIGAEELAQMFINVMN